MAFLNIYMSTETIGSYKDDFEAAIKKWCGKFNFEPALIKAIAKKESRLFPFAYRVDYSVLKRQTWYRNTLTVEQKKYKCCWASYGYTQILFGLARKDYGYKGTPHGLMDIDINVYYCCRHLEYLRKRYKNNLKDMIHAYNWGSNAWMDHNHDGIHDPDEPYRNQAYVDEVYKYYQIFGGKL